MTNPILSNTQTSVNPDIPVRATAATTPGENFGKYIQHTRIDKGVDGAESVVTDSNPLPVTNAGGGGAPTFGYISYEGVLYPVKSAIINESSMGDNPVIEAVPGLRLAVVQLRVLAAGAVNIKFRSGTTDIDGLAYLTTDSGYILNFSPVGWFTTNAGEALNLNLSAAVAVGGILGYAEIP